jgi:hypothetical protein
MKNYVEIFINEPATTKLDLNQEFDISLQYSIADIRDITKRNAAFSKTIMLPGTKNNNYWLGNLYDINSDFTFFNPNFKTPCSINVNSEVVMKGFLQLRKIKKLVNVDHQGNLIYYEVVIFNNTVDLMTEIGEKKLNELDLDELTHSYNFNNVVYSWTQSYANGWVYPMYGLPGTGNIYGVTDFYPAYYSKYLLEKIFQEAGFGITGSLLTNSQFEKEILPFVGSGSQSLGQEEIDFENFRVGVTQSFTQSFLYPFNFPLSAVITSNDFSLPNFIASFTYSLDADNFTNNLLPQTNYFDNNNNWDTSTYIWTTTKNRKWKPRWQFNYDLTFRNPSSDQVVILNGNTSLVNTFQFDIQHQIQYQFPSQTNWNVWHTVIVRKSGWFRGTNNAFQPGESLTENINFYDDTTPELFIPAGTKVRLKVEVLPCLGNGSAPFNINHQRYSAYKYIGPPFLNSTQPNNSQNYRQIEMSINYKTSPQNFFLSNGIAFDAQEGDPILASRWISGKLKQKDFLIDLIRRYNLYIQVNPTNDRMLILDTRTDFYNKVLNLNWTNKKDYSSEDEITLLSELQFKELLLTMKDDDSDTFLKDYKALTGDTYGQYQYIFGNEFVKGEKKIESPYSPTTLIKTSFGAVTPALDPQNPKVNPRVLYWGGLISTPYVNFSWELRGIGVTSTFNQYPYAGHFDNPYSPTLDIHFGTPQYMYYTDYGALPVNTMYEQYWSDWVNSIEDGKLVTSSFYLDECDIRLIKDSFWAKIFILDSYYYVNKIIDYKPMSGGLTRVELLKIKEGFKYQPQAGKTSSNTRPPKAIQEPVPIGDLGKNNGTIGIGGGLVIGNNNSGGGKVIVGSYSFIPKQFILGDDNVVVGNNTSIIGGDGNISTGSSNMIIQSSNNMVSGENMLIIGNTGQTFSESNTSYIGSGIIADLEQKSGLYDGFNRGVNIRVEGNYLGQSDYNVIPQNKEVVIGAGQQANENEVWIRGHLNVQPQSSTFSFGNSVVGKGGLLRVETTINVDGLLSVSGETWVGVPQIPIDKGIGVFYSTISQSPLFINTPRKISMNTSNISLNISLTSDSRIVIKKPDYYRMSVTLLLENLSNSSEDVIFWLKFNGVDYPNSGHFTTIAARKSVGVPSDALISYDFIGKSIHVDDYVELYWQTTSTDVSIKTRTISGIPNSPSVIVNINKI